MAHFEATAGPVTVIVVGRGRMIEGEHHIRLSQPYNEWMPSSVIVKSVAKHSRDRKTTLMFASEASDALMPYAQCLSEGSTLMIVSNASGVIVNDVPDLFEYLNTVDIHAEGYPSDPLSTEPLFDAYLTKAMKWRFDPQLRTVGSDWRVSADLMKHMHSFIGTEFSEDDRMSCRSKWGRLLGEERVDEILAKITGGELKYHIDTLRFQEVAHSLAVCKDLAPRSKT